MFRSGWPSVLFWMLAALAAGCDGDGELANRRAEKLEMMHFRDILHGYVADRDPPTSLENAITLLKAEDEKMGQFFLSHCSSLARGMDVWGKPLFSSLDPEKRVLTVISAGANGRYESGGGDDLMVSVQLVPDTSPGR